MFFRFETGGHWQKTWYFFYEHAKTMQMESCVTFQKKFFLHISLGTIIDRYAKKPTPPPPFSLKSYGPYATENDKSTTVKRPKFDTLFGENIFFF
jgi:hypothetical protein